ncbi:MAG TPA: hypothetical protein PK698_06440 [Bacilli bacterium]|nr:hypothetical protein [Bacilli bacterium]
MDIKLTNRELKNCHNALLELSRADGLSQKTNYWIGKVVDQANKFMEQLQKINNEKVIELGEDRGGGNFYVKEENKKKYDEFLNELLDDTCEIRNFRKIKLDELLSAKNLKPTAFIGLYWLLEEEESENDESEIQDQTE